MVDISRPSTVQAEPTRNLFKEFGIPVAITLIATGALGAFGGLTSVPGLISTVASQSAAIETLKTQITNLQHDYTTAELTNKDLQRQADSLRADLMSVHGRMDRKDEQDKIADVATQHAIDQVSSATNSTAARVESLTDRQNSTANAINALRAQVFEIGGRARVEKQSAPDPGFDNQDFHRQKPDARQLQAAIGSGVIP